MTTLWYSCVWTKLLKRMYNLLKEVWVMWNCPSMANEHEDQEWPWLYDLDESDVFFSQPKLKVVKKEKQPQQIVNPSIWTPWYKLWLTLFVYSKDKKKVIQLIPCFMWKVIYGEYKEIYFNLMFQEDTLKDHTPRCLKRI